MIFSRKGTQEHPIKYKVSTKTYAFNKSEESYLKLYNVASVYM